MLTGTGVYQGVEKRLDSKLVVERRTRSTAYNGQVTQRDMHSKKYLMTQSESFAKCQSSKVP